MSGGVDLAAYGRGDDWSPVRAVVAGFGEPGFAAADNLVHVGAQVTVLDDSDAGDRGDKGALLEVLGADIRLGPGETSRLPDDVDVLIASPGWSPSPPLLEQARARGVAIWGQVELAWRLRDLERPAPWLAVSGTRGKTSTVRMLESMLVAGGLRTVACGGAGMPLVQAVMDPEPYDVLAVELSDSELHYVTSMSAESAAVLNVTGDHPPAYPDPAAYADDLGRAYEQVRRACVYNAADPVTEELVREADVVEGARAIGFTLGTPRVGMVGVVDDVLADRAFVADREKSAAELGTLADLADPSGALPTEPHVVANALAAAALARAHDVAPAAVREGLRRWSRSAGAAM